jgi:hypothetical protein
VFQFGGNVAWVSRACCEAALCHKSNRVIDSPFGLEAVLYWVQIDALIIQGLPEPLEENAVQIVTVPIHKAFDIGHARSCG